MSSIDSVSHTVNNTDFFSPFFSHSPAWSNKLVQKNIWRGVSFAAPYLPIRSEERQRITLLWLDVTLYARSNQYIFIIIRTKKPYLFSINTSLTFLLAKPSEHFLIRQVYEKYFSFDTGLLRIILTHQVRMNMKSKAKNQIKISS